MKNPAFILTNTLFESLRLPCLLVLLAGMFHQAYARESTVSVQLTVPDGGWKIRIDRVYQTPTHLLAVSKLERSPGPAIQVISQAKDSVKVKAPKLPVRHFVLGKTWNWPNKEPYAFLSDPKELSKPIAGAKLVYQAKAKPAPKVPAMVNYIVVYKKEIFTDGKTKQGKPCKNSPSAIAKNWEPLPRACSESSTALPPNFLQATFRSSRRSRK